MIISRKDALLQRSNKQLEKLQIEAVESHLTHMNVTGGNRLVTSLQTLITVAAICNDRKLTLE